MLITIALLWFAAAVAPGPNLLVTMRAALLTDRPTGLRIALGIACGAGVWGLAGFFGIQALFGAAPWLYLALKLGGSVWLVVIGVRYLLNSVRAAAPVTEVRRAPGGSTVLLGFVTSIANPQTALSTASLFAATLPPQPSLSLGLEAVAVMMGVAIAWYSLVACVLTTRRAAAGFARSRRWIDCIAGLAFLGFGTRLALQR